MNLTWITQSRNFDRSADGRFDLMLTHDGIWLAIDADLGKTFKGSRVECVKWCEERTSQRIAA